MKASWKILAFAGSVALAAGAGAACTVTSGSGDDDGGDLFGDAGGGGSDTGTGSDTSTPTDSGGGGCTALTEVDPDGGSVGITYDTDGGSACDNCLEQNCCTAFNGCFQDTTGDCQELNACINECVKSGGAADGGNCECDTLHTSDSATLFNNVNSCYSGACAGSCPQ